MTKKVDVAEEEVVEEFVAPTPRIAHDFLRTDLNEMRDALNEVYQKVFGDK